MTSNFDGFVAGRKRRSSKEVGVENIVKSEAHFFCIQICSIVFYLINVVKLSKSEAALVLCRMKVNCLSTLPCLENTPTDAHYGSKESKFLCRLQGNIPTVNGV